MQTDNTWQKYTEEQVEACNAFCAGYIDFLSKGKTERECVKEAIRRADYEKNVVEKRRRRRIRAAIFMGRGRAA